MPVAEGNPQTLYDKVLQAHVVDEKLDGTILLYIGKLEPVPTATNARSTDKITDSGLEMQTDISFTRSPLLYVIASF
ncbi:hypothetical protein CH063_07609, partial [Colletotrichum higginsianum]